MTERPTAALVVLLALHAAVVLSVSSRPADAAQAQGGGPTFYRDVLPVLQRQCQSCHRPHEPGDSGLAGPMALMTYEETRPWAAAIARRVRAREMPPWRPSPAMHGLFEGERGLSDAEIATLEAWAATGAPGGQPGDAPAPLAKANVRGWALGEPDLTITAQATTMPDEQSENLSQHEFGLVPENMWVQGIEFRSDSPAIHHMCAVARLPASTPGPDRETSLGCAAPGTSPRMLPEGSALLLPKGAIIRFEIHGHKNRGPGTSVRYQPTLGLTLAKGAVRRRMRSGSVTNSTFEIPPGRTDWIVGAVRVFERDTTILALQPHGHFRAVAATFTAVYPDGKSEVLLDVPRFDWDWQEVYWYRTAKTLPAGTRLEVAYRYDNSAARGARSGFDATERVVAGPRSTDEMLVAFVNYTDDSPVDGVILSADTPQPLHDAADRDLWWRGSTTLWSDGVVVSFPRFSASEARAPAAVPVNGVLTNDVSAAMKLRTTIPLVFGATAIGPGNVATGFAGLYGLWLKKTADGWRLVFTNEPDVLGNRWNPATAIAEVPVRYDTVLGGAGRFAATLFEEVNGEGRLVITWDVAPMDGGVQESRAVTISFGRAA